MIVRKIERVYVYEHGNIKFEGNLERKYISLYIKREIDKEYKFLKNIECTFKDLDKEILLFEELKRDWVLGSKKEEYIKINTEKYNFKIMICKKGDLLEVEKTNGRISKILFIDCDYYNIDEIINHCQNLSYF